MRRGSHSVTKYAMCHCDVRGPTRASLGSLGPAFALCIVAFAFGGQQPPPTQTGPAQETVVRIVVNLVQVDAVVTDARDRPVTGLQAEDFEIYQDGRKQKITNFSYVMTGQAPAAAPAPAKGAPPAPPPRLRREEVRRTI